MRIVFAASALALAVSLSSSCSPKADAAEHGAHAPEAVHAANAHAPAPATHQPAAPHGAHWSYGSQSAWASFSAESGACGGGREQSPIHLSGAAPAAELPDLGAHYAVGAGAFVNNGHTLQYTPVSDASTLTIGSDAFRLAQFHFHSPSEHLLDRRAYPLELHFVHRNQLGRLAVVGVFIEEGAPNEALAALIAALPAGEGEESAGHASLDPEALMPADRTYYAYAGSLTTPPCSEGVRWHVLRTPITASAEQIATLREALGASSRHVQPLNARTVLFGA